MKPPFFTTPSTPSLTPSLTPLSGLSSAPSFGLSAPVAAASRWPRMTLSLGLAVLLATGLAACGPQGSAPASGEPQLGSFGIDLSHQDPSVSPGDDFFRYANGRWLDEFELPADRSSYGIFTSLAELSEERVRAIIDELAAMEPATGSIEQKIAGYYNSWMDADALNDLGIAPLQPGLAQLAAISNRAELITAMGRDKLENTASPFPFGVSIDRLDPDRHQLAIFVGGIGLPDRDYYLEDTEEFLEIRREYVAHIARMLNFADISDSAAKADAILALETRIAEHIWPRADRRNRDLTHNPMSYAEFVAAYPGLPWDEYFAAGGISNIEDINVFFPSAMAPVIALLDEIPLADWRDYMTYHYISNHASLLSEAIDKENFAFYGTVLNGTPEQRERWERGVQRVGGIESLGEAIGQVYVRRHFPESAKTQMEDLVENLRVAIADSINEIDWMGTATKDEAHRKLQSFRPKIAYPDRWKDLSDIEIGNSLFDNALSVRAFFLEDEINRLGKRTDREEWFMTPQMVNAYYNPSFNEIVFPAAILQPPFFDPNADPAVNYGAIGAVIGHEMGHGFDDQGSKSDYQGIQRNWWSEADRANFEQLAAILVEQYGGFEPVPGYFIDGEFTLGENIGDVGGLSLAYRAYQISLDGEEAPVIDGLTGDQRFFLSWAQVWQGKYREEALLQRLKTDPHSPAGYRVNGVVRNFDEWYAAFDVQPDAALYLPPEQRTRIW